MAQEDAHGYVYSNTGADAVTAREATGQVYDNVGADVPNAREGIGYIYENVLTSTPVRTDAVYAEVLIPQAYAKPPPVKIQADAVYAEGLQSQSYTSPPPVKIRADAVYAETLTRVMGTEIHYVDQVGVYAGTPYAIPARILANNPVGYWKLNQASGATSAIDSSANANPALTSGGVTFASVTAPNGSPAAYIPLGGYLTVSGGGGTNVYTETQINHANGGWTVRALVRAIAGDTVNWFLGSGYGTVLRYRLYGYQWVLTNDGRHMFWLPDGGGINETRTIRSPTGTNYYDNQWHEVHICNRVSADTCTMWIDGVQVFERTALPLPIYSGSGGVAMGRDGDISNDRLNAYLSDVAIFNGPLVPDDLNAGVLPWATPTIRAQRGVHPPSGISSAEAFGTPAVIPVIGPVGIPSAEAFGEEGLYFWYDDFASSGELVGEAGTIETTNAGAEMEPGEPAVLSGSGTATVWFRITPVYDGFLSLDTQGSTSHDLLTGSIYPETNLYPAENLYPVQEPVPMGLDTVLDVFTGYGFENLKLVAHNDDTTESLVFSEGGFGEGGFGGGGLWSSLTMPVRGGTTYYIRVNSWDEDTGTILLNWSLTHAAILLPVGSPSLETFGNQLTRDQATFEHGIGWVPDDDSCTLALVLTP